MYSSQQQYDKALKYYEESLTIQLQINNQVRLPAAYHNQGRAYLRMCKVDKALEVAQMGMPIARRLDNLGAIFESALLHSDIYFAKKDFKKAFEYLQE